MAAAVVGGAAGVAAVFGTVTTVTAAAWCEGVEPAHYLVEREMGRLVFILLVLLVQWVVVVMLDKYGVGLRGDRWMDASDEDGACAVVLIDWAELDWM